MEILLLTLFPANLTKLPRKGDKSLQSASKSIKPGDTSSHQKQKPVAKNKKQQPTTECKSIQPHYYV